jgi:hypothetical protein
VSEAGNNGPEPEGAPGEQPEADDAALEASDDGPAEATDADAPPPKPGEFEDAAPGLPAIFETLWARVLEDWTNEKTHGAFLEFVIREKMLPDAAGRYRAIKDAGDDRSALAKKKIDAIVIAATQMLTEAKTPPPEKNNRWMTVFAFIVSVILLFVLARAVFRR